MRSIIPRKQDCSRALLRLRGDRISRHLRVVENAACITHRQCDVNSTLIDKFTGAKLRKICSARPTFSVVFTGQVEWGAGMAREAVSPAQKLVNRYVFNGAVFTGLAALALGRYAWVSFDPLRDIILSWGALDHRLYQVLNAQCFLQTLHIGVM